LASILGSVGHKVKIHKITPGTGKERDLEIKDYVVLQKPQETWTTKHKAFGWCSRT
jgi:hypothetical protein